MEEEETLRIPVLQGDSAYDASPQLTRSMRLEGPDCDALRDDALKLGSEMEKASLEGKA